MVVDGDDAGSWCRHALSNHALVADVLLSFRDPRILLIPWQHRLDPDRTTAAAGSLPSSEPSYTKAADSEKDDERPSSSLPPPLPAEEFPDWGRRIRRSWTVKASRIREAMAGKSRRRRRPSPLSALDGCSSASTSWTSRDGEEGSSSPEKAAKMPRSFDDAAPVGGLPPKWWSWGAIGVRRADESRASRRGEIFAGRERRKILTEWEDLRRAAEELKAGNQQLLSSLDGPKAPVADANAAMALEPPLPVSRQSVSKKFLLPDLNELPDCLD